MRQLLRIRYSTLFAGATLLLATLVGPSALAHDRHVKRHHGHHGHHAARPGHGHGRGYVRVAPAPVYVRPAPRRASFMVPRRIVFADRPRYDDYYRGVSWYAPHRHDHVVYAFPVFERGRWIPQRHDYCEGTLYGGGRISYSGSRLSVSLGF